jgi:hypothetical protein
LIPVLVAMSVVSIGCDKFSQASEAAEFSIYYATLGTQLGQLDQQFPAVNTQLVVAVSDAAQREAALAAASNLCDQYDRLIQASAPSNPNAHRGHQGAVRMVERRRAAIAQLRTQWNGTGDPSEAGGHLTAFGNEWMNAAFDFMNAVGQDSQQTLGAAAQAAQAGALANNPAAQAAVAEAQPAAQAGSGK